MLADDGSAGAPGASGDGSDAAEASAEQRSGDSSLAEPTLRVAEA